MFELKSDPTKFALHAYPVSDTDLVDPRNANPLYIGEWLALDNDQELIRSDGTVKSYVNYIPRGDTTAQSTGKVTVITRGGYFARTRVMDAAAGASINAGGLALEISNTVVIDTVNKAGLIVWAGGVNYVVAHSVGIPANGWLEFQATDPTRFA